MAKPSFLRRCMPHVPVALADILLIRLLLLVRAGRTFSPEAVGSLRGISWCCLFEGAYLIFVGIFMFDPAAVSFCMLAFAAVFLGIVLRVVKNVIEEATAIKPRTTTRFMLI